MAYKVVLSKTAQKDLEKIRGVGLGRQVRGIVDILGENPYKVPPLFEKLLGDMKDRFSRRINIQHRCVYRILPNDAGEKDENGELYAGVVRILSLWTHYER